MVRWCPRTVRILIVGCSIFGCAGSEPPKDEESSETVSDDGTCAFEEGTYTFSYSTLTGDCPDLHDEVVVAERVNEFETVGV